MMLSRTVPRCRGWSHCFSATFHPGQRQVLNESPEYRNLNKYGSSVYWPFFNQPFPWVQCVDKTVDQSLSIVPYCGEWRA